MMPRARPAVSWLSRMRIAWAFWLNLLLLFTGATVLVLLGIGTFFQAKSLYAWLAARWARLGLWLCGIRIIEHDRHLIPAGQTVYISNHTSMLDLFIIPALDLPRARYFMSGFVRWFAPFAIYAWMVGTFWTPLQKYTQKRRQLFAHAAEVLRRTGDSVYLTPEGQVCGVFNKGAFHLAASLKAPLQPFFIAIPSDCDPGPYSNLTAFEVRPGAVHIHYRSPVDTSQWRIEDIPKHRDDFREFYADWACEMQEASQSNTAPIPSPPS